eukprot:g16612.t1
MTTHLVKIKLDGDLRIMEIPSPPRFDGLVKAVMEAYAVPSGRETELTYTYRDNDGDEVRFDSDAELDLAVRTSSVPLRIMVQNPRSRPAAPAGRNPRAAAASTSSSIPSTPGYAVASNVGSVLGDDDDADMIMVEVPPVAGTAVGGGGGSSEGGGSFAGGNAQDGKSSEAEKSKKEEIDAPAAFQAETEAARDPEGSLLYQKASIRLAKRFKVHLTPTQLWRVMALFQIQGRQLVITGLAPHRALNAAADPSASGASSDEDGGGSSTRAGGVKRSKDHVARGLVADPVHRLLSLNGVELPEEEVQPLLEALRVRPRRLVRLNLLPPDVLQDLPDEHRDREGRGPRGGPHGRHMHDHMHGHGPGGRFSLGRRGGGGRGGRPMPFRPPPPFFHQQHHGGAFSGPHSGVDDGRPPHHGPPPNGPPPHMAGMGRHHMEPPHGHHPREGPPHPPPHMWQPYAHGYGGPPGPTGDGYGYGYGYGGSGAGGDWHEWAGPYGGGGGGHGGGGGDGSGECVGAKRGFGKGTKDNMAMARFVSHPSGSDVARVVAGQTFKKSWLVRNDSTTAWPETCSLIPVSQSSADLSPPPEAPIVGDVAPGEEVTVSVDLVAPTQPGMYEGYWRVRDSSARKFGQRLWAKVMVVAPGKDVNAAVERLSLDDNGN